MQWCNVYAEPDRWRRQDPTAAVLTRWIADHLFLPHPQLGRPGPVCPFVRHSANRQLLWAGCAPSGAALSESRLHRIVDDASELYRELRRERPTDSRLLTVISAFPGLTSYDVIDSVHRDRKSEVVADGLMLGQFYPGCPVPGLWNREFRPLQAPVPMLVLRPMMSTDFPFLAARTEWLDAYLTRFAPDLPRRLRHSIAESMLVTGDAVDDITGLRAHAADEHAK
ncbi:MAG: hypothetical protein HOQ24_18565 [Mycobacteriaceae bacterium]|nr:hypothetical protein [Mycobacteriaceae bacterium]